jgi:hypothetical protein
VTGGVRASVPLVHLNHDAELKVKNEGRWLFRRHQRLPGLPGPVFHGAADLEVLILLAPRDFLRHTGLAWKLQDEQAGAVVRDRQIPVSGSLKVFQE